MPTANPLEQLRRRMLSHATPAAFAALAEEHRRAGRLDEAIAVCRDGLARYPTYASARVTLGRALLDSGDVGSAVSELEQAVAQAPDNLAAVRALDTARDAWAALPAPPPRPVEPDLTLHEAPWAEGAAVGPDAPQEFGLGPDWTLPEVPPESAPSVEASPAPDAPHDPWHADDATQAVAAHADAPTMSYVPAHLQGEEPAGIWPVPVVDPSPAAVAETTASSAGGAPVYGWSIAAPDEQGPGEDVLEPSAPATDARASIWDEPVDPAPVQSAEPPIVDSSADPAAGSSGVWEGLFVEPVSDGAAPATFAGWDAPGPSTPEPPAWAVTDTSAPAALDDGGDPWGVSTSEPSSLQAERVADSWYDEAPAVQEAVADASIWDEPADAGAAGEAGPEPAVDEPAAMGEPVTPAPDWAGSVASALDEVFAQAGQPPGLEPPTHASPAVRTAMADAAVEAAIEDTALRDDTLPPALVSLQQMLDAVRARRAALFPDLKS